MCRFVNTYTDGNTLYKVFRAGEERYQVYQQPVSEGELWEVSEGFQAYDSFDDAQRELNKAAVKMGWGVIHGNKAAGRIGRREYQAEKEDQ